jgi:hypothetical protein
MPGAADPVRSATPSPNGKVIVKTLKPSRTAKSHTGREIAINIGIQ